MPNHRDLNLAKYSISKSRYRELYYFCLQYDERARKIADLEQLQVKAPDGMPHGTGISDPTAQAGFLASQLRLQNEAMEKSAREADAGLYCWLLDAVRYGLTYNNLKVMKQIPCGQEYFHKARRKFFYILDGKQNEI